MQKENNFCNGKLDRLQLVCEKKLLNKNNDMKKRKQRPLEEPPLHCEEEDQPKDSKVQRTLAQPANHATATTTSIKSSLPWTVTLLPNEIILLVFSYLRPIERFRLLRVRLTRNVRRLDSLSQAHLGFNSDDISVILANCDNLSALFAVFQQFLSTALRKELWRMQQQLSKLKAVLDGVQYNIVAVAELDAMRRIKQASVKN